jgi:predicted nucleic acid-binding protein
MRVYLDNCCFGRPYDDQSQERVRLEAEAVFLILRWVVHGTLELIVSDVVDLEAAAIRDVERRERVQVLARTSDRRVRYSEELMRRGDALEALGFGAYDALHIACAEAAEVDVLFTTDDRLLKRARRLEHELSVSVMNPLTWVQEQRDR